MPQLGDAQIEIKVLHDLVIINRLIITIVNISIRLGLRRLSSNSHHPLPSTVRIVTKWVYMRLRERYDGETSTGAINGDGNSNRGVRQPGDRQKQKGLTGSVPVSPRDQPG